MYRCTECHTEYQQLPEFCDCGNDQFEEVSEVVMQNYDEYEEAPVRKPKKVKKLTPEEIEELEEEKLEKIKSLVVFGVAVLLAIVMLFLPPHKKPKLDQVQSKTANVKLRLPSVETYWDNSLPSAFKNSDPLSGLPLLNSSFSTISPELREYLVKVGNQFNRRWNTQMVEGTGACTVQFIIDKEGGLKTKSIIKSSDNQMLDDSVNLLLTNLSGFDMPPEDYKGERIYITFSIDDRGLSKVSYPSK